MTKILDRFVGKITIRQREADGQQKTARGEYHYDEYREYEVGVEGPHYCRVSAVGEWASVATLVLAQHNGKRILVHCIKKPHSQALLAKPVA